MEQAVTQVSYLNLDRIYRGYPMYQTIKKTKTNTEMTIVSLRQDEIVKGLRIIIHNREFEVASIEETRPAHPQHPEGATFYRIILQFIQLIQKKN